LRSYDEEPGWYQHPPGTVALKATNEELRRDGIDLGKVTVNSAGKQADENKANEHTDH
jgi:hypothetical protein